jgi:DHA1 family inner membrane transport protein
MSLPPFPPSDLLPAVPPELPEPPPSRGPSHTPIAPLPLLLLFALVNLIVGSSAFLTTGIVELIAQDLKVSVPAAGQTMTAYAISTALLAPLVLVATSGWPRRRVLVLALALFTAGNALSALAPSLPVLLAGRVLMGLGAVFTPVAAGIAVALVAPAQRGKALALVFLGVSLSYVVGLPIGSWLGFRYGWAVPLWLFTGLSALALLAVAWRVPAHITAPGGGFVGVGALLRRGDLLAVLGFTLLYFTAIFSVFAYIGPVLQALVPMSSNRLALTLSLFGVSGMVGTLVGGASNDRFGAIRTIAVHVSVLGLTMLLLPLTAGHRPLMLAVMLVWGVAGFGMMAPQQSRLATLAPAQAPLLLSLNTSMLYFGTALGAALGGAAAVPLGFGRLSWIGVPLAALSLALLLLGRRRTG